MQSNVITFPDRPIIRRRKLNARLNAALDELSTLPEGVQGAILDVGLGLCRLELETAR